MCVCEAITGAKGGHKKRQESETECWNVCSSSCIWNIFLHGSERVCLCVNIFYVCPRTLWHMSYHISWLTVNIKPYTDVKLGSKSDIKPQRITAACVRRDSFMCITPRYMDTQVAAPFNILCFTCGRKPETNYVSADQTLTSCEKYEQWRCVPNSQQDK